MQRQMKLHKPLRAVPAWFWYTAFLYHYSYSTITAPFPSPSIRALFSLASLHFLSPSSFSPLAFTSFPAPPFFSLSSHSILLCIPIICPCSFTGFVTRDYACDVMLGRSLQRRALGPAALFSVAPDCRWRRRHSPFFARRHIFPSTFSFSNL